MRTPEVEMSDAEEELLGEDEDEQEEPKTGKEAEQKDDAS